MMQTVCMYLDGTLVKARKIRITRRNDYCGNRVNTTACQEHSTALDEMRFSHARRTPEWIKFCFENQKADSRVVQVGNR